MSKETNTNKTQQSTRTVNAQVYIPVQLNILMPIDFDAEVEADEVKDGFAFVDIMKHGNKDEVSTAILESLKDNDELLEVNIFLRSFAELHKKKYPKTKMKLSLVSGLTDFEDIG